MQNRGGTMDATTQAPVSDDQELAKVLESMNKDMAQPAAPMAPSMPAATDAGLQFEEPASVAPLEPVTATAATESTPVVAPVQPVMTVDSDLESIKKDALGELRPLVDKLDLPADEKFDTLLLIIRSTDDKGLIGAAHEAAKAIEDDSRRAEALLDVIKEIDYFSHPAQ